MQSMWLASHTALPLPLKRGPGILITVPRDCRRLASRDCKLPAVNQAATVMEPDTQTTYTFQVLSEEVQFNRYVTVYNRRVKFPAVAHRPAQIHEFDVIGHPKSLFQFAVVFPYSTNDGTVTLVEEYAQGINSLVYSLPTGGFDPSKHEDTLACAKAELSEEVQMQSSKWLRLIEEGHPGCVEGKWSANRFTPFIALDPTVDTQPGSQDSEEFIQVMKVAVPELKELIASGRMLPPSVTTCFLALEHLSKQGLLIT